MGTLTCSTTSNANAGTYTIRVQVSDNNSQGATQGTLTATQTFTLTVTKVNSPPIWGATFGGPYSVNVYSSLTIPSPTYTDADTTDTHTFTCRVGGAVVTWISSCTATSVIISG